MVDLTLDGIGRDRPRRSAASRAPTGVHIVMGTGAYVGPTHPDWVRTASVDELAAGVRSTRRARGVGATAVPAGDHRRARLQVAAAARGARASCRPAPAPSRRPGLGHLDPPGPQPGGAARDHRPPRGRRRGPRAGGHRPPRPDGPGPARADRARSPGRVSRVRPVRPRDVVLPVVGRARGLSDAQRLNLVRGLIDAGFGDRVAAVPRHLHQAPAGALRRPRLRPPADQRQAVDEDAWLRG